MTLGKKPNSIGILQMFEKVLRVDVSNRAILHRQWIKHIEVENAGSCFEIDIDPPGLDEFPASHIEQQFGLAATIIPQIPAISEFFDDITVQLTHRLLSISKTNLRAAPFHDCFKDDRRAHDLVTS